MSVPKIGNHTSKLYQRAIDNRDSGKQAQTLRQQAKEVEAQKTKVQHAQKYASEKTAAGEAGKLHNLEKKFMTTAVAYYNTHQADGGGENAKLARASLSGLGNPLYLTETSDKRSIHQQNVDLSKTGLSSAQKTRVGGVLENKPSRWSAKDWRALVDAGSNPAANKVISEKLKGIHPSLQKYFQQDRAAVVKDKNKLNQLPFPPAAGSAGQPADLHPDAKAGLEAVRKKEAQGLNWPSLLNIGINSPDSAKYIAGQIARTDPKAAQKYTQNVADAAKSGKDSWTYAQTVKAPESLSANVPVPHAVRPHLG